MLSYSTMLGGGSSEYANGIAVDSSGNAYITGSNDSGGFTTTPGAFQTDSSHFSNAFVTKLDPTGSSLVYSTYLNGSGFTFGTAIAVDASGNAYVTGRTNAGDFPTVNPIRSSATNFYRSTDSRGHWNSQVIGTPDMGVNVMAIDPLTPNTMYAGMRLASASGVYKTTDGGNTWAALNTGLTNVFCGALAINPTTPTTLYASLSANDNGTLNSGLYKSTDGGNSWAILTNGLNGVNINALAIDPSSPNTVYAGSTSVGVYKSTNGGASWVNSSSGLIFGGNGSIAIDPVTPQTVYLATGGGVFKSTNGGGSWVQMNTGLTTTIVHTLNITPNSTIYAGTSGGGVFKSTNGGASWTLQGSQTVSFINSIVVDPATPTTVYAGGLFSNGGVFKSTDAGVTWQRSNNGMDNGSVSSLAIDPIAHLTLYASTAQGIFKTVNGAASWTPLSTSMTGPIIIDPTTPTTLYTLNGGFSGGVSKSTDGGINWTPINSGLTYPSVSSLVINPKTPAKIYAGVNVFPADDDAFVVKLNPSGTALLYSTLLGGRPAGNDSSNLNDVGNAIAVDSAGNAYVAGQTRSPDFPVTPTPISHSTAAPPTPSSRS